MSESTITSKGQITIPKAVREALHLGVGDTVYFEMKDDGTVVMRARNAPVEALFGLLKSKSNAKRPLRIDEMNPASSRE